MAAACPARGARLAGFSRQHPCRHITGTGSLLVARARDDPAFDELCSWIDFFGGHVHHKLDVGITSLGCRGVITRDVLTEDDQRVLPCMAVPDSLTITRDVAAAGLDSVLSPLGFTSLERFSDELQVALFLAAERRKGSNSRFHSYIMTMPERPSCGWLMTGDEAAAALEGVIAAPDISQWVPVLGRARAIYEQDIGEMEDYMDALQLDPEDLRWGLGQAVSRAYGASPRLIPALDCVNHSRLSSPPIVIRNEEGAMLTCVSNMDAQYTTVELDAGSEIFVSYAAEKDGFGCTPIEMFIDYAFVPEELLERSGASVGIDDDFDYEFEEGL